MGSSCRSLIGTQHLAMGLNDQWKHIKDLLSGKASDPGRTATDHRKLVDAVLWSARNNPLRFILASGRRQTAHKPSLY